jgi:predicted Zn-dependent peptidase
MQVEKFTLDNGLTVLLLPLPHATSTAVELAVRAGSIQESNKIAGLAHFLEHMAFKGTEKWPSARELSEAMDRVGALYNAYTGKENTAYWLKTAPEFVDVSLEVLSQMWLHALIKKEELEIERGVILEEYNMYLDQPRDHVDDLFEQHIFGDNNLGRSIIGEVESIKSITLSDFMGFREKWYKPNNMVLVVAGKIKNKKELTKKVKKLFGKARGQAPRLPQIKPLAQGKQIEWKTQKTQQSHFVLGVPTVAYGDEEKFPPKVLSVVLGGSMSSRLWREIRERRGLAYYVACYQQSYPNGGYLAVKSGVNNNQIKKAMDLSVKELLKVTKDLTGEEVEIAKQVIRGRFLISFEDSYKLADLLSSHWLFTGKAINPLKIIKKYERITKKDVDRMTEKYLSKKSIVASVIGPKKGQGIVLK